MFLSSSKCWSDRCSTDRTAPVFPGRRKTRRAGKPARDAGSCSAADVGRILFVQSLDLRLYSWEFLWGGNHEQSAKARPRGTALPAMRLEGDSDLERRAHGNCQPAGLEGQCQAMQPPGMRPQRYSELARALSAAAAKTREWRSQGGARPLPDTACRVLNSSGGGACAERSMGQASCCLPELGIPVRDGAGDA